jgi:hypothetical protein
VVEKVLPVRDRAAGRPEDGQGTAADRCSPRCATELEEGRNPPLAGGSSYLLRWRLRPLADLGVVQRHIAARRATPPISYSTSLDGSGCAPSSAARPPTATLRLSSDAGRRIDPTTTARLHHINILIIVCSFLSSPSDDTSCATG